MIGRIEIENYKSIEKLSLDLGRVTVLIGANGSGKSNILEAIALCSAAAANKLDNEFLFSRGIRVSDDPRHMRSAFDKKNVKESSVVRLFDSFGHDEEPLFAAYLSELEGTDYSKFTNRLIDDVAREIIVQANLFDGNFEKVTERIRSKTRIALIESIKEELVRVMFEQRDDFGLMEFLAFTPENSALRRFEEEGQIQPLGIRGEGLFKLLTVLARETEPQDGHDKTRLDEIQERLQLLDWFGDFQIGGNVALGERTLRIRDQYLDGDLAYFTQRSANEGFLFLLFYFTLFVAKETPRFFAIDNIDTSLNPKLCAELLRQLTELAEKYDKQVILTTHNPAVLDGLNLRDENQKLYVVERDLEGKTQARRIEPRGTDDKDGGRTVRLSEAFLRGYIGGLPSNF